MAAIHHGIAVPEVSEEKGKDSSAKKKTKPSSSVAVKSFAKTKMVDSVAPPAKHKRNHAQVDEASEVKLTSSAASDTNKDLRRSTRRK